jgi:hypothetical protein
VFEDRLLRRIFGPKREEVVEGWRRLHNGGGFYTLYTSPNVIRVIKSRRMGWVGHVARWERSEVHTISWLETLKRRDHSEDLGADVKIILEWILGK